MRKFILSLAALFATISAVSAQDGANSTGFHWGAKAGINISGETNLSNNYRVAPVGGFTVEYRATERLAVSADLLFSGQGSRYKGDGTTVMVARTSNLTIPILANFYITPQLAVKVGIQPGFILGAKGVIKIDGPEDIKASIKENYKSVDLSIPLGLSYTFDSGLSFDARYNLGTTNIAKHSEERIRNSVFAITAGWKF